MTEHIGRKQALGFGRETTAGTGVNAALWFPKMSGVFKPVYEKAKDGSAYGVIDGVKDSEVTMETTEVSMQGIVRDEYIGHFMYAALGTYDKCQIITITGQSGGTPARGDSVSSATDSWAGTIKKIFIRGATTYYAVATTSGTLTSSGSDLTDGTWTGGTWAVISGVEGHFFSRLNTNAHPTYSLYGSDPIGDDRAVYGMLQSLDLEIAVGDYAKLTANWMAKKLASTSSQSPSYAEENAFLGRYGNVYFASDESGLNAASASVLQRFKLSIAKNLQTVQKLGDVDVNSIHNQVFGVTGDFEAIYTDNTLRDYVANTTKKAARLEMINTSATALATGIYPSLTIDIARGSFENWDRSDDNDALVSQTLGFEGEFDVDTAMTIEALILNDRATSY